MNTAARRQRGVLRRVLGASGAVLKFGLVAGALIDCSVDTLPESARPAVTNTCSADKDCGSNGVCTSGACYARSGTIDEVLLEIIPETTSPFAHISFLSMQEGLRRGDWARSIALPGPVTFQAQVQVNGEDLDADCPYLHVGKQSVAARIQFVRTGSVGGLQVSGLSSRFQVTVDTEPSSSGYSKTVSLVPGFYDIYAKPTTPATCQIASKIWRGVEVGRDGQVAPWAPPATLDLPTPLKLTGRVTRVGGDMADWQVELIDPQDAKVISTSARLGATTDASPTTNFAVTFQPLDISGPAQRGGQQPPGNPIIQLRPPKGAEGTAPVMYFDAGAAAGSGPANLELSKLPNATAMVTVAGQVRGVNGDSVRATVRFVNTSFQKLGLPASFGPATATDDSGHYTTRLFSGTYRVVIVPEGAADNAMPVSGANPTRSSAITELTLTVGPESTQSVDLTATPTRIIEGAATAGVSGRVAQGANLEAFPFLVNSPSILDVVRFPGATPAPASVAVDDTNGRFSLVLDPGFYDFTLKPAATSNFAWWLFPNVHVVPSDMPNQIGTFDPQLPYPVPLGGTLTVAMADRTSQPLRNATVKAYGRVPFDGGVIQVGATRTDDMGRYYLALPPGFYDPQP
jgi:hypothetical protein